MTHSNVAATLAEIVAFNTISARANGEIIAYLENALAPRGWRVRRHVYADDNGFEKVNLVAFSHEIDAAELALVGHTDTVPFAADWTDALSLIERDGKLYARGACDTKGFIAAMLAAVETVELKDLSRPLALVFTADEEVGCVGAKKLADAKLLTARYALVGEPTSLQPMRAGKGYCLANVTLRGREGHSAYPASGASAVFRAARLIVAIERLAVELQNETDDSFDPPFTTLNVGIVRGGTAKNVIAGECQFTLEWRPIPSQRADYALQKVEALIAEQMAQDRDFNCEVEILRLDNGMATDTDSPLVKFMEDATGKRAGTVAFGTEAPQMAEMGAEAVVIGAGDIRVAHQTGEYVPRAELEQLVKLLQQSVARFCN